MNKKIKSSILATLVLVEEGELTPIYALKHIEGLFKKKEVLTFADLKKGDKFIALPVAGDDSGHGGLKGSHVLFYKWPCAESFSKSGYCGKNYSNGTFSTIPDSMSVIKIV